MISPGHCHRIIEEVAQQYGISPKSIIGPYRRHTLIQPRHEAMYRCLNETSKSLPVIANIFHRDHSTVGYGAMLHAITTNIPPPRNMSLSSYQKWRGKSHA
jgi:chromosomal replication initiation ATPase DnaA